VSENHDQYAAAVILSNASTTRTNDHISILCEAHANLSQTPSSMSESEGNADMRPFTKRVSVFRTTRQQDLRV
jgi:hypothetical protein